MKNFFRNDLPKENHKAETTEFATLSNGIQMPMIGLGVMHMHGNECVRAVCEAVDAGYRIIDTAAIYGNEVAVGKGIRDSGVDREKLFVTIKLWVQDADERHAKTAYEKSLGNLGLEYVDLFLIHQPLGDIYGAWRSSTRKEKSGRLAYQT